MLLLAFFLHALLFVLPLAYCAEDYYRLLGLDKSCSTSEIKRAYRTLSKKYHPDKNPGNDTAHQKFVQVSEAYEALSDSTSRKIYDQYGHEGLENHKRGGQGAGQAHDPFDLFSRFFGGGGHFGGGGNQVRRGPDSEVRLDLPLRDFYNGREVEITVEKQQICDECEGSGSADGVVHTCDKCSGRGIVVEKHQLAPGIFQQVQRHCDKCGGQGKKIKHVCKICGGAKVVRKAITLIAEVEKGMAKGHRLIFENEADEHPDHVAGNLIVVLMEKQPELGQEDGARTDGTFFRRKERELYWKEVLSLREAWMGGWTRNITHLDGHVVQVGRQRGEVVQPFTMETVEREGMPVWHGSHHDEHEGDEYGKLYIEYTVVIPDQMDKSMEKDFFSLWEKWRSKKGVDLGKDSGRPPVKDEL
jgi:DnaJ-related protein SCJ1